ncbi:hypothetical protein ACS0TY_018231 [Phlomoides rotata]
MFQKRIGSQILSASSAPAPPPLRSARIFARRFTPKVRDRLQIRFIFHQIQRRPPFAACFYCEPGVKVRDRLQIRFIFHQIQMDKLGGHYKLMKIDLHIQSIQRRTPNSITTSICNRIKSNYMSALSVAIESKYSQDHNMLVL